MLLTCVKISEVSFQHSLLAGHLPTIAPLPLQPPGCRRQPALRGECRRPGRAGNTRHGAAGAPGFRRGVVAGLGLHGIGLPGRMEMEADPCWRALSERLKLHRSGSPKQCLANGPVLRSSILALR